MSGGNIGGFSGGAPPNPPPQNVPVSPFGPGLGPVGPLGPFGTGLIPPEDFVPFGLNHIILILLPQFKSTIKKAPGWVDSTIKISMPITVFFDKLDLGPDFPPGIGMPPPGLGIGPPGSSSSAAAGDYPYGAYPYSNFDEDDDDDDGDPDSSEDTDGDTNEGYENDHSSDNYYGEEDRALRRRRRKKRNIISTEDSAKTPCSKSNGFQFKSSQTHKIKKRSVPFNHTIHASERAVLLPKLERILDTTGLGGKSCLLRAICEVHEAPLHHYGLLGEMFTMLFSVSRSIFAESHLSEYLRAELTGKAGDCSEFYRDCDKTLFSWEEQLVSVNSI